MLEKKLTIDKQPSLSFAKGSIAGKAKTLLLVYSLAFLSGCTTPKKEQPRLKESPVRSEENIERRIEFAPEDIEKKEIPIKETPKLRYREIEIKYTYPTVIVKNEEERGNVYFNSNMYQSSIKNPEDERPTWSEFAKSARLGWIPFVHDADDIIAKCDEIKDKVKDYNLLEKSELAKRKEWKLKGSADLDGLDFPDLELRASNKWLRDRGWNIESKIEPDGFDLPYTEIKFTNKTDEGFSLAICTFFSVMNAGYNAAKYIYDILTPNPRA